MLIIPQTLIHTNKTYRPKKKRAQNILQRLRVTLRIKLEVLLAQGKEKRLKNKVHHHYHQHHNKENVIFLNYY